MITKNDAKPTQRVIAVCGRCALDLHWNTAAWNRAATYVGRADATQWALRVTNCENCDCVHIDGDRFIVAVAS